MAEILQTRAEEAALNIPEGKTVWDVIEEKLLEYKDIPAIEYFGRVISYPEFIDKVYTLRDISMVFGELPMKCPLFTQE